MAPSSRVFMWDFPRQGTTKSTLQGGVVHDNAFDARSHLPTTGVPKGLEESLCNLIGEATEKRVGRALHA